MNRTIVFKYIGNYLNELMLYSGQFALFYILMNFSGDGLRFFNNFGHTVLLIILILQTFALVLWGHIPVYRFVLSLSAPAIYTILEMREGAEFVLNMAHVFFWISSLVTGLMQSAGLRVERAKAKKILEFMLTMINVGIFIIVYFYFDVKLTLQNKVAAGLINTESMNDKLQISYFYSSFSEFMDDRAHIYIVMAGIVLAVSLAMGRIRIINLTEKIKDLFGRYVDRDVRDRIISHGGSVSSESRYAAILFSDIRNFTALSENNDPQAVTGMLNEYFTWWDREVRKHGGIIDKYIGDALMVIFGLDDAGRECASAVECASGILSGFEDLNKLLAGKGLPVPDGIGIGINYGKVILGDIGSEYRKNFTVIGDAVNVASRLESLTKKVGSRLVISEEVYERLDSISRKRFSSFGEEQLKGRTERIGVFGLALRADE